ncbi:MAG: YebC/PmpR family DNA-binding transcriptional regulator [Anaerolineaceae bacterium]|nr:MAG: YebC/PmpR family DNA-binding transcriptional regulator [Anaerolineaceae bacterium]
MSGHSKWSTIKRKKAAIDAKRGALFTRLAREISLAAREGGGDPNTNFGLRLAIERAKNNNMPKGNIERAIDRGTGKDKEGAALEQIMYEGYAPNGVALMIDVVTDNRNRAVAEVRHVLTSSGGNLADAGSVAWQFRRAAYFAFTAKGHDQEEVFDMAVEAGADDVILGDDDIEIIAPVESFKEVSDQLREAEIRPDEAALKMMPNSVVQLPSDRAVKVMRIIEELEDLDDVQNVYSNLDITEEAVVLLEAA